MSGPGDRPSQDRDPSASEQDLRRESPDRGSRPADPWRSSDLWPESRPGAGSGWDDWSSLPPPNDFVADEPIRTFSDPWSESWADEAAAMEPPPASAPESPSWPSEPAPREPWPEPAREPDRWEPPAEPAPPAPDERAADPWGEPAVRDDAPEEPSEPSEPSEPTVSEPWRPAEPWLEDGEQDEVAASTVADAPAPVPDTDAFDTAPAADAPDEEASHDTAASQAVDEPSYEPGAAWSRQIGLEEAADHDDAPAPHVAPWSPDDDPWGPAASRWDDAHATAPPAPDEAADEEPPATGESVPVEEPPTDEMPGPEPPAADEEPPSTLARIDGWRRDFLPSWLTGRGADDEDAAAASEPEPTARLETAPAADGAVDAPEADGTGAGVEFASPSTAGVDIGDDAEPAREPIEPAWEQPSADHAEPEPEPELAATEPEFPPEPAADREPADESVADAPGVAGPIAWEEDRRDEIVSGDAQPIGAEDGEPDDRSADEEPVASAEDADTEPEDWPAEDVPSPATAEEAELDAGTGEAAETASAGRDQDARPWASREPELTPDRYAWLEQDDDDDAEVAAETAEVVEDDLDQPAWSASREEERREAVGDDAQPVTGPEPGDEEQAAAEPEPWPEEETPTATAPEAHEPPIESTPYRRGRFEQPAATRPDWLPDIDELEAGEMEERTRVLPTSWAPPAPADELEPVDRSALAPHATPSRTRPSADVARELDAEPEPEATAAEQAVPWLIGFILLLAGMVIVLLALIFAGDGSLGGSATSPEPSLVAAAASATPTAVPSSSAAPAASATPAPSLAPATPTPVPQAAPEYGPLEMVYQGRAAALAPIYLLHREFTTESEPAVLAQDPNLDVRRFAWAGDGTHGAGLYADLLVSIEPGTEKRQLADSISTITFSPDGSSVMGVRVTRDGQNDVAAVVRIAFDSGDATEVARVTYRRPDLGSEAALREAQFEDDGGAIRLFWMENNRLRLWVLGAGVWEIDPASGTVTEPGPGLPALWSPDGRYRIVLAEDGGTTTLTRVDADGSARGSTTIQGLVSHVRWSPDSDRVVFTCGRSGSGGGVIQNLYLWDLGDGVEPMQITDSGAAFGAEWLGARVRWRDDPNAS